MSKSETIRLHTGKEVPKTLVESIQMSLKLIYRNPRYPMALYELVTACRDESHVPFGNTIVILGELGFIQGRDAAGRPAIRDDIRSIVLASTDGSGVDIRLVSPYSS